MNMNGTMDKNGSGNPVTSSVTSRQSGNASSGGGYGY
jgi:hypothetical protein